MSSTSALLGVLTVLTTVNLVLLLGVVRRLNDIADRGAAAAGPRTPDVAPADDALLPTVGSKIGNFRARALDGSAVIPEDLTGQTLVGFFSVGCKLCHDFAPRFGALAAAFPGGRDQVLAVVVGEQGAPTELPGQLAPQARVIVETFGAEAATAFGIRAFPAFCLLEGRVVVRTGLKPEALRLAVVPAEG